MDSSFNRSPFNTTVSRKVISLSEISAVNLMVGYLFNKNILSPSQGENISSIQLFSIVRLVSFWCIYLISVCRIKILAKETAAFCPHRGSMCLEMVITIELEQVFVSDETKHGIIGFNSNNNSKIKQDCRKLHGVVLFDLSGSTTLYFDCIEACTELVRLHLKHCQLSLRYSLAKPAPQNSKHWHLSLNCCFVRPAKLFLNIHQVNQQEFVNLLKNDGKC